MLKNKKCYGAEDQSGVIPNKVSIDDHLKTLQKDKEQGGDYG